MLRLEQEVTHVQEEDAGLVLVDRLLEEVLPEAFVVGLRLDVDVGRHRVRPIGATAGVYIAALGLRIAPRRLALGGRMIRLRQRRRIEPVHEPEAPALTVIFGVVLVHLVGVTIDR